MRVFISGKISGDKNYVDKFCEAEEHIKGIGHVVLNPTVLPEGFGYLAYLRMCRAMIDECDIVCMLPDWRESNGAMYEYGYAMAKGKPIVGIGEIETYSRIQR